MTPTDPPQGFDRFVFETANRYPKVRSDIPVYTIGPAGAPPVIVMHELTGLSRSCLDLAEELAVPDGGDAFRVYLPMFFGSPGMAKKLPVRGLWCMRREMHFLASNRTSPITGLLRELVVDVAARSSREKVGVIGMCLTGHLVFGLMAETHTGAVVASQPSLPWSIGLPGYKKAALGVSDRDLIEAVHSGTPLMSLRFGDDRICPAQRLATIESIFGPGPPAPDTVNGKGHSVLTDDRGKADPDRVPLVREFLHQHLG